MRSPLALTLTLLVVSASPAGAATVRVDIATPPPNPKFPEPSLATVVFTAAAGEVNAVEVGEDAAGAIVVTERGGAPRPPIPVATSSRRRRSCARWSAAASPSTAGSWRGWATATTA